MTSLPLEDVDLLSVYIVIGGFVRELFSFGGWNPAFGMAMPILLFFYFLLLGASVRTMSLRCPPRKFLQVNPIEGLALLDDSV
jgi:hypothetical protein